MAPANGVCKQIVFRCETKAMSVGTMTAEGDGTCSEDADSKVAAIASLYASFRVWSMSTSHLFTIYHATLPLALKA